jgi:hypothetical protein
MQTPINDAYIRRKDAHEDFAKPHTLANFWGIPRRKQAVTIAHDRLPKLIRFV